jgi:hypothetical protein
MAYNYFYNHMVKSNTRVMMCIHRRVTSIKPGLIRIAMSPVNMLSTWYIDGLWRISTVLLDPQGRRRGGGSG